MLKDNYCTIMFIYYIMNRSLNNIFIFNRIETLSRYENNVIHGIIIYFMVNTLLLYYSLIYFKVKRDIDIVYSVFLLPLCNNIIY